jgi:hypothetical protein
VEAWPDGGKVSRPALIKFFKRSLGSIDAEAACLGTSAGFGGVGVDAAEADFKRVARSKLGTGAGASGVDVCDDGFW